MGPIAGRAYIREARPDIPTPTSIAGRFVLHDAAKAPALDDDDDRTRRDSVSVLDVHDVEGRVAIQHLHAIITCFELASDCEIDLLGYWIDDIGSLAAPGPSLINWGHCSKLIPGSAVDFADRHYPVIEPLGLPEEYSRVANALRLYGASVHVQNADLALLGFVGALESLFSIAPQELSFRLSLTLARFLGDEADSQKQWFDRAKKLYVVRSKVAHGDKLSDNEESAAVSLVEFWVPEAETFARLALQRLLEHGLVDVFNSKNRHERLLTELLFAPGLAEAVKRTP